MESIMSWVISALSGHVSREMIVFIISMVPILELRGGLLAASVLNINITRALWICIIGNIIPVPFILLLITPIFNWLKQTKTFRPMVEKVYGYNLERARNWFKSLKQKYPLYKGNTDDLEEALAQRVAFAEELRRDGVKYGLIFSG